MVCKISVFNTVKCQRSQCAYQVIYRTFIPSFFINPQMYTGGGWEVSFLSRRHICCEFGVISL